MTVLSLMLLASSAMGGCGSPDGPSERKTDETPLLRITLDISGTSIASVVAQATATDFDTITLNLQVAGDTASGTMEIPAGSDRLLMIRAYDAPGVETHRGQTTLTVLEGTNPAVTVVLEPLTGQQEIVAVIGQVFVTIVGPSMLGVDHSDTLAAIVTDVNGDTLTDRVQWGSLTPEIAKVDTAGIVTALDTGQARIVALYGGVGAEHAIDVLSGVRFAEAWIETAFKDWFHGSYTYDGPGFFLSTGSFQHSSPWSNAGMTQNSAIPRPALVNASSDASYQQLAGGWTYAYRSIREAIDALHELDVFEAAGVITPLQARPYRAFALFTEGLAYGNLAVLYDQGSILKESNLSTFTGLVAYPALMDTALVLLGHAAAIADSGSFTIPPSWLPRSGGMSAAMLSQVAHSMRARLRAAAARNPAERAAVDWAAVNADVDAGVTGDWVLELNWYTDWYAEVVDYSTYPGWAEATYFIVGMADQAGNYQKWLAAGLGGMAPILDGTDVLIVSPDLRFPRGATVAEQQASPGTLYKFADPSVDGWNISDVWAHPERGAWRWSYYWPYEYEDYASWFDYRHNEIDYAEMRLLEAEALYRTGDLAGAASLINVSRTANGLAATDAAGSNADCVPRMPDGSCGDLFEMLKWEKRMQVRMEGLFGAPWYFDARGWGDLYQGTFLQLPVPCTQLLLIGESCYTFGGTNPSSAPVSTYAWPGEATG